MAAGTGWVAVKDRFLPPFKLTGEARVCLTEEVPVGGTHPFSLVGTKMPYILVRPSADEWFAYEQKCTHLSCAVYYSPASGRIECPCHMGFFDVRSGKVLQGPPPRPLHRLDVVVRDATVFVRERSEA
jgi:Rieske Fe-S protein